MNTVVIVESNAVFRKGLLRLLCLQDDLDVTGIADDGDRALGLIERKRPDLAIVDLSLGSIGGLEIISRLRRRGVASRILVLTMHDEPYYVHRALECGANGYVLKQEAPEEILKAVREVLGGGRYISPSLGGDSPVTGPRASS